MLMNPCRDIVIFFRGIKNFILQCFYPKNMEIHECFKFYKPTEAFASSVAPIPIETLTETIDVKILEERSTPGEPKTRGLDKGKGKIMVVKHSKR
jgi:hypothetical protein